MITWSTYYKERLRREDEIAQAVQDRLIQSASQFCESWFTILSIQVLEAFGSRLVQWGNQLQCRCAELSMTNSKRAI